MRFSLREKTRGKWRVANDVEVGYGKSGKHVKKYLQEVLLIVDDGSAGDVHRISQ